MTRTISLDTLTALTTEVSASFATGRWEVTFAFPMTGPKSPMTGPASVESWRDDLLAALPSTPAAQPAPEASQTTVVIYEKAAS